MIGWFNSFIYSLHIRIFNAIEVGCKSFLEWHCKASKKKRKDSIKSRQHFLKQYKDTWKSCGYRIFFVCFQHIGTAEKTERLLGETLLGNAKIILLQNFLNSEAKTFSFENKLLFCHITRTLSFLTSLSCQKTYTQLTAVANNLGAYLSFCSKLSCKMTPCSVFSSINFSLHSLGKRGSSPESFAILPSVIWKCTISAMLDLKLRVSKKQKLNVAIKVINFCHAPFFYINQEINERILK